MRGAARVRRDDLPRFGLRAPLLAVRDSGPGVIRVTVHIRGDGPDQRAEIKTVASREKIVAALRHPSGLAVLTGTDGVTTVVSVAHVGWITLEDAAPPSS